MGVEVLECQFPEGVQVLPLQVLNCRFIGRYHLKALQCQRCNSPVATRATLKRDNPLRHALSGNSERRQKRLEQGRPRGFGA